MLKEHIGKKRILLTDEQRQRLAVKGKMIGRKTLCEVGSLFTPDTVAKKWNYSKTDSVWRDRDATTIRAFLVHYHPARNHQGFNNERIVPRSKRLNASAACSSHITRLRNACTNGHHHRRQVLYAATHHRTAIYFALRWYSTTSSSESCSWQICGRCGPSSPSEVFKKKMPYCESLPKIARESCGNVFVPRACGQAGENSRATL